MPSIEDWAAKAARRIHAELPAGCALRVRQERIAAIIETFAAPMLRLLRESRRAHQHCDDSWYCCGACTHPCDDDEPDHEHTEGCCVNSHDGEAARKQGVCNCGADEWNAKIDAALEGI